jgi:hypothetical protein
VLPVSKRLWRDRAGTEDHKFMLTVIAAIAAIIASYASKSGQGSFPIRWGWLVAIVVVSAYVLSRGFAKSGVRSGREYDNRD